MITIGYYYKLLNTFCFVGLLFIITFLFSCTGIDPRHEKLINKNPWPKITQTNFDLALKNLGKMTYLYNTDKLKIMCDQIYDRTGTSKATGAEIPQDVTVMTKNAINTIKGNVHLIDVNQAYQYSNQKIVLKPDVILKGGITEFDRGVETRSSKTDLDLKTKPFTNIFKFFPGKVIGIGLEKGSKSSRASVTLDYYFIEFQRKLGVQGISTKNHIDVYKGINETELGFHIFGGTIGLKGNIKNVDKRHAATRLLMQCSLIQLIGKFFDLPYWNLLEGIEQDNEVIAIIQDDYDKMNRNKQIIKIQELLYIHGFTKVQPTGIIDKNTLIAIKHNSKQKNINLKNLYLKLYLNLPISSESLKRRANFNNLVKSIILAKQKNFKKEIKKGIKKKQSSQSVFYLKEAKQKYMDGDLYLAIKFIDKAIKQSSDKKNEAESLKEKILLVNNLFDQAFNEYYNAKWQKAMNLWRSIIALNKQIVGSNIGYYYENIQLYLNCVKSFQQKKDC